MKFNKNKKGALVVEVVIALGIFVVVVTGVAVLYVNAMNGTAETNKRFQADMLLQQGFEAVRAIRDYSLGDDGYVMTINKGLSKENGYWEFSGDSDIVGEFTRTIEYENVLRDENCNIVESGGEPDPDTTILTITIDWDQEEEKPRSISATKYFHNLANPKRCTDEAEDLSIDISQTHLGVNNKKIIDITLENTGLLDVTIDKISLSWSDDDDDNNSIEWIVIEQSTVWQYHGDIGSPQGRQPSGTELDIVDYVIPAYESHNLKEIKLNHEK